MIIVHTHEAKTHLSKLLNLVAKKHEVVRICRNGKPMAELVEPGTRKQADHLLKNPELAGMVFHKDPAAPLPEEFSLDFAIMEKGKDYASS